MGPASSLRCLGSKGSPTAPVALVERQLQALSSLEQEQVRASAAPGVGRRPAPSWSCHPPGWCVSILHHTVIIPQPSPPSQGAQDPVVQGEHPVARGGSVAWMPCGPAVLPPVASWSLANGRMTAVSAAGAAGASAWPALARGGVHDHRGAH